MRCSHLAGMLSELAVCQVKPCGYLEGEASASRGESRSRKHARRSASAQLREPAELKELRGFTAARRQRYDCATA